jgi:hypothetical protein
MVAPARLRAVAGYVMRQYALSERHACRLMEMARSTQRYRSRRAERDAGLRVRLKELAAQRMRFGYRLLTVLPEHSLIIHPHSFPHQYREEGLAMRIRQPRRIRWNGAVTNPAAARPNQRWSMDFVSDCMSRGKVTRMLTLADDCTLECRRSRSISRWAAYEYAGCTHRPGTQWLRLFWLNW